MSRLLFALCILIASTQAQSLSGTWWGALEGPDFWGGLELTIEDSGGANVARARIQIDGRLHAEPLTNVATRSNEIAFRTIWEGRQVNATGRLEGDRLRGTLSIANQESTRLLSSQWNLVRLSSTPQGPGLPVPRGPYATGRSTFDWIDESGYEARTPGGPGKREVLVHIWYPTSVAGGRMPYLPDAERMMADLPSGAAETIRTLEIAAQANAPILRINGHLPVVIFSPGHGVKTLFYSALQQELASHGFVVAAIEHPSDAPVVVFPDGRATHASPPQPSDLIAQRRAADYRAKDILFVKRRLAALNQAADEGFGNSLDLSKVSVVGHSLGGMAAFRACQLDPGCSACISIDGAYRARPYPADVEASRLSTPFLWLRRPLFIFTDAQLKQVGLTRTEFDNEVALGQRVMADDTGGSFDIRLPQVGIDHMDFSDVRVLERDLPPAIRSARRLTLEMTRAWVRDFLQAASRGESRRLLTQATSAYREARVSAY